MLKLINKRLFEHLRVINALRNRCGHLTSHEIDRKKRSKGGGPQYILAYRGQNLFKVDVLLNFMEKYNDVFLHLCEKATGLKLR